MKKKYSLEIVEKYLVLIMWWSSALAVCVLFIPTGVVYVSFFFGVVHSWALLASPKKLYGFNYFPSVLLGFVSIWLLPAIIWQLNCWFQFTLIGARCTNNSIDFVYISISGGVAGAMFLLMFLLSKFPD